MCTVLRDHEGGEEAGSEEPLKPLAAPSAKNSLEEASMGVGLGT